MLATALKHSLLAFLLSRPALSLRWDAEQASYNLNTNQEALQPLQYSGEWKDHDFTSSPDNWRIPFYTILLDRFVNGNPSNDDANGTQFEQDITQTTLRHGGDIKGLQDSLDYLQGMGIKALYLAGSPFINVPWAADGYSPLDMTLLDHHFGTIAEWQEAISEVHRRGMYVVMDNTMSTMGDLIGFENYLNVSTPFKKKEHNALWKSTRRYNDFTFGNDYLDHCAYPRFYGDDGLEVKNLTTELVGCRDSEFDQYGEVAAFGDYPEWQRQISKFAFVQDRLREWRPDVLAKIEHFSCMTISMLDIDGYRMDKGLTITVDAQAHWSDAMRQCARKHGKENFYISGEIVGGNVLGSVYIGRGRTPDLQVKNVTEAVTLTNESSDIYFIRDVGQSAFDGAAFHYTVYRFLTRFLGLDGTFGAEGDPATDFTEFWSTIIQTNDMINANTGKFDPRHMYGVTNQDVFRWPTIRNGTQKYLLGHFIITLMLPGIPTLTWGEEQAFYLLDSTAANYVYGRSPMSSAEAWGMHGCFKGDNAKYYQWPLEAGSYGCLDENVNLDHRDPSHPIRNIIKHSFEMRQNYPVLQDGFSLTELSKQTYSIYLPGSDGTATETGLWSMQRAGYDAVQKINQTAWLVYTNENATKTYNFNCKDPLLGLVAPFKAKTTVKNMFFPFDEVTIDSDWPHPNAQDNPQGCLSQIDLSAWGYKAFVPKDDWVSPSPVITKFIPGHDFRMVSSSSVMIEFHFSLPMDCDQIKKTLLINSTTADGTTASLDDGSVQCSNMTSTNEAVMPWVGSVESSWSFKAMLNQVSDGVHQITLDNVTVADGDATTNSVDHFLLRVGQRNNPIVFPKSGNYSSDLLISDADKKFSISHKAPGADQFRYSLNFGTTYSDWEPYGNGSNTTLAPKVWSGTDVQKWDGEHVIVQYWSRLAGSSSHVQHGDLNHAKPRRFPHFWLQGTFNQYGFDAGFANQMRMGLDSIWRFNFMTEWPAYAALNAWGLNPDGQPDQTRVFGDIDGDLVLDRIPPLSLVKNHINISESPPSPYLSWQIALNDANMRYELVPVGSRWAQLALYLLLWIVPILTGILAIFLFMRSFYSVKFNSIGITEKTPYEPPITLRNPIVINKKSQRFSGQSQWTNSARMSGLTLAGASTPQQQQDTSLKAPGTQMIGAGAVPPGALTARRRNVLLATMEYDIEDWGIKIKIGGLGVMANLMCKNLGHQDLIWVVPCVGGVEYPIDCPGESIIITVLGNLYEVKVQYHCLRNITYVLLDAPIFRQQTKADPYPPRMDDLDSACYYSAWNSCIAEMMRRFPIDLYHINDYHGTVAPLHLLPTIVPCVLSLHNAEFQGLWPMRNELEKSEVCAVFNLDPDVVGKYVQFGEVFNLLHAGASYLRVHQKGFGAVGVSNKYGKRAFARYPILWGLQDVGALPNPDPTDTAPWNKEQVKTADIFIDEALETAKPALKLQAQQWAELDEDPDAELFVFVGRWSQQKGVDSIADVFPSIMESNSKVQLICIGPVIDLYGRFAAMKLEKMMEVYPGRVFSKPEFTALPPYIFSGADFALMPSRDEPFGLVAVEFGRKGALCVGARVGGLGHMPGWWFTIESTTTKHFIQQFKIAIQGALASKPEVRAIMRARAAKQRFPVAQWIEDLEKLQSRAIDINNKQGKKTNRQSVITVASAKTTPTQTRRNTPVGSRQVTPAGSRNVSRAPSPARRNEVVGSRNLSSRPTTPRKHSRNSPTDETNPPRSPSTPSPPLRNNGLGSRLGPTSKRRNPTRPSLIRRQTNDSVTTAPISEAEEESDDEDSDDRGRQSKRFSKSQLPDTLVQQWDPLAPPSSQANWPFVAIGEPCAVHFASDPIPTIETHHADDDGPPGTATPINGQRNISTLSLSDITGGKTDYKLQNVSPFFTDPKKEFAEIFQQKLEKLSGKTSEDALCIEEYLVKSEKIWFGKLRAAELGKGAQPGHVCEECRKRVNRNSDIISFQDRHGGVSRASPDSSGEGSVRAIGGGKPAPAPAPAPAPENDPLFDEFLLGADYKPPTGLRHLLLLKIGDWPLYSVLLAFGQIIAANSYQITLLTGSVGQPASKLYVIASIYLITSCLWWLLYRRFSTVNVLSFPFVLYGLAFFLIGVAPLGPTISSRGWIQNVATAFYAAASSSGSIFFAVNFGAEGGAPVHAWTYRACVIQGTQQIYVVALWYWGSALTKTTDMSATGASAAAAGLRVILPVGLLLAILMWAVGVVLFLGLPKYYRQAPGGIPSFYTALFKRNIISWFFLATLLQNYFLSAPYGRNWLYLWSSQHAPAYSIALLIILFFIIIWALSLYIFGLLSHHHSWILPIFAMGLGAPRWAQLLWSTSNIGMYVPWAGGPVASAIAGRALWLWLGVLDALQGVGFGMVLLQTLTRVHVLFTLLAAQVLGSVATILARATAPDKVGPGDVFPNFASEIMPGLGKAWFWVGLFSQLAVPVGFFLFFRKEQLSKP